jgi:hypothetical protein
MKIVCRGKEIKVFVNGRLANHGTAMTIHQGAIALQSEGTPVDFKEISLKPLAEVDTTSATVSGGSEIDKKPNKR